MNSSPDAGQKEEVLAAIKLVVTEDLYRAFQRCVWIQVHENSRTQLDIMDEIVRDFLRKYGC